MAKFVNLGHSGASLGQLQPCLASEHWAIGGEPSRPPILRVRNACPNLVHPIPFYFPWYIVFRPPGPLRAAGGTVAAAANQNRSLPTGRAVLCGTVLALEARVDMLTVRTLQSHSLAESLIQRLVECLPVDTEIHWEHTQHCTQMGHRACPT